MFGLIIRSRQGYYYMNVYPFVEDVVEVIKEHIEDEELLDDIPPTVEEIKDRLENSLMEQYIHELSDGSLVVVQEVNPSIEVLIEVKNGLISEVKSNVPLTYFIKDLDETAPYEWLTPWKPDEVVLNIYESLKKEVEDKCELH